MNEVCLIGRLTVDPNLRYLPSQNGNGTAITKFQIAINRSYKKNNQVVTDFIPVEVWGKVAEFCANYLEKGRLVALRGSLHIDRYVDDANQNRTYSKVVAKTVQALDYRNKGTNTQQNTEHFQEVLDDEEIPF